jgi:ABC-type multidrug transport system fused ATPase/permease subunit
MPLTSLEKIIPMLQVAIGPVILISGVGLLLLTMTNRLGRTIDRARLLKAELSKRTDAEREQTLAQVAILYRRAQVIRLSITLAALSALLASALIITLFVTALLQWEAGLVASLIFIACMTSLFASLLAFIRDINLSLHALKLELKGAVPGTDKGDVAANRFSKIG